MHRTRYAYPVHVFYSKSLENHLALVFGVHTSHVTLVFVESPGWQRLWVRRDLRFEGEPFSYPPETHIN